MELEKIRRSIDSIDSEIIRLLSRRIEYAVRTRRFKESVGDPSREKEVLDRVKSRSKWLITPNFSESIFSAIIAESRRLQSVGMELVGFHGEHGSPSEYTLSKHKSSWIPIPCQSTDEIFEGVKTGGLDFGIIPVESSSEGSFMTAIEPLIASDLFITSELIAPVQYALMTLAETDYRDVKVVYSTVEALSHCKEFLHRHRLEGRPYYDAAGAAQMLTREKPPAAAVIAHPLCSEVYGLQALKEQVEEHAQHSVRYIIISRAQNTEGTKCTISFATKHEAGSLLKTLQVFADKGINLTRIDSCANPEEPTKVTFLVDFEGSSKASEVQQALNEVKKYTENLKSFGSYSSYKVSNDK